MTDNRTISQWWSDKVTEFSGSWGFIFVFTAFCAVWIYLNVFGGKTFDAYPFLFLNWILTIISTFQSPLIMMSNNRQNEMDRQYVKDILDEIHELRDRYEKVLESQSGKRVGEDQGGYPQSFASDSRQTEKDQAQR